MADYPVLDKDGKTIIAAPPEPEPDPEPED